MGVVKPHPLIPSLRLLHVGRGGARGGSGGTQQWSRQLQSPKSPQPEPKTACKHIGKPMGIAFHYASNCVL
jgi:hypothetical protein